MGYKQLAEAADIAEVGQVVFPSLLFWGTRFEPVAPNPRMLLLTPPVSLADLVYDRVATCSYLSSPRVVVKVLL